MAHPDNPSFIDPREIQRQHTKTFLMVKLAFGLLINGDFTMAITDSSPLNTGIRVATKSSTSIITDRHILRGLKPEAREADTNGERVAFIKLNSNPGRLAIYVGNNYEYELSVIERDSNGAKVQIKSTKPLDEPVSIDFNEHYSEAAAKYRPQS